MTLDQKVGALLTLGFAGTVPRTHIYDYIEKYHCGGLRLSPTSRIFGNYIDPHTKEVIVRVEDDRDQLKKGMAPPQMTASQYKEVIDELQEIAMNRPLGIPLHFSYDQEGGTSADFNFGGVNLFTKPMGLRATGDPKLAYEVAKAISKQSKAVGFNWIHSPVLDINVDPRNPEIYTRSYSDRVEEVVEYAIESCKGFKEERMIATGKHFPGRGDSAVDAHYELPTINVDEETLMNRELLPYRVLIEQDLLPSIMLAHSIFPAIDPDEVATVSKKVVTGLLREKLGFNGVITTDSMTMGGIAVRYGVANACAMSLEAGADLVLMKAENYLVEETIGKIKEFVETGRISMEELDKKVYRVLSLKYENGLFTESNKNQPTPEEVINDPQIVFLSKQVAKKSILIPRDRDQLLPLDKKEKILIIEQINKTPNNGYWHPGLLLRQCMKYNRNLAYIETLYAYGEEDKANITRKIEEFDTVIFTNFYIRGSLCNTEFINEMVEENPSKKIIVLTNTPYPLSIPEKAGTVVLSFATSPDNLEAAAGILFGEIRPEGEWPIAYQLN